MAGYFRRFVSFLRSSPRPCENDAANGEERRAARSPIPNRQAMAGRRLVNGARNEACEANAGPSRRPVFPICAINKSLPQKRKRREDMEPPYKKLKLGGEDGRFNDNNCKKQDAGSSLTIAVMRAHGSRPVPQSDRPSGSGVRVDLSWAPAFVCERPISNLALLLKWLMHTKDCMMINPMAQLCPAPFCREMQQYLWHLTECEMGRCCTNKYCVTLQQLVLHYDICWREDCGICTAIRLQRKDPLNPPPR